MGFRVKGAGFRGLTERGREREGRRGRGDRRCAQVSKETKYMGKRDLLTLADLSLEKEA